MGGGGLQRTFEHTSTKTHKTKTNKIKHHPSPHSFMIHYSVSPTCISPIHVQYVTYPVA
jgi:hypothetical protein